MKSSTGEPPLRTVLCDAEGRFEFSGLRPGYFLCLAYAKGFYTDEESILPEEDGLQNLRPGQDLGDLVVALKKGRRVQGRVVDEQGRGVEGATIANPTIPDFFFETWQTLIPQIKSGPEGQFEILGAPVARKARFKAKHPDFPSTAVGSCSTLNGDVSDLRLILRRLVKLRGQAIGPAGPIDGASFIFYSESSKPRFRDHSRHISDGQRNCDPEGFFEAIEIPSGPLEILSTAPGLVLDLSQRRLDLAPGKEHDIRFRFLEPPVDRRSHDLEGRRRGQVSMGST